MKKNYVVSFSVENDEVYDLTVMTNPPPIKQIEKQTITGIKEQILAKREADKLADMNNLLLLRGKLGITEVKPLEQTNDIVIIKVLDPLGEKYCYPNATFEIDTPDEYLGELEPEHFYIVRHPEGNKKQFLSVIEIPKEDAYKLNKYYYEITKAWQLS